MGFSKDFLSNLYKIVVFYLLICYNRGTEHSEVHKMAEETKVKHSELSENTKGRLTPEEQIEFLQLKLEQAELKATEKSIALIEMTASRNALYQSLQETQMRLAENIGQRENDIEAYQKELDQRLQEKRALQEKCDELIIKAKRYDELQESLIRIKMNAEKKAHGVIDEAQEKAMDTIILIDDIEKEINYFRDDLTFLRRDIKIGTYTLDDRLENVYVRLCRNLEKLHKIKEDFYIKNSLPMEDYTGISGMAPVIEYPETIVLSGSAETECADTDAAVADLAEETDADEEPAETAAC